MAGHVKVDGVWEAIQSNEFVAKFDIKFTGRQSADGGLEIDGGARCSHSDESVKSTAATGRVLNDHFQFTVTWDNDTEGLYEGFLRRSGPKKGRITGDTHDLINDGSHATWHSSRNFPL